MLRFAPSPNGRLHKGHALSALANDAMAKTLGRPLLLRMEDIDRARCRAEHEDAILADLDWLGICWQPPLLRQSDRFEAYGDLITQLAEEGLLVPSVMTRREISHAAVAQGLPRDPDGAPIVDDERALIGAAEFDRRLSEGAPAAFRLDMAEALRRTGALTMTSVDARGGHAETVPVNPAAWGNVVLARKETPTSYHLSVVADDAAQAVSHVVRGDDLFAATAVHRVLQVLFDWPAPYYHHHRLVLGADGRKLSKSNGAESLAALREAGLSAAALKAEFGV